MEAVRFLTDEERVRFLSRAESRSYEPDEVILGEGDYNEDIFILIGGKARVDKQFETFLDYPGITSTIDIGREVYLRVR